MSADVRSSTWSLYAPPAAILAVTAALIAAAMLAGTSIPEYYYLAAYTVLQFVVLGSAWNILGGYAGYVNFGVAGFFAIGCYTTIALNKLYHPPLVIDVLAAAATAGLAGLLTGYLTLRLRGVFFSIATLALAIVVQTIVVNWRFVGGSRGIAVIRPETSGIFLTYAQVLLVTMAILAGLTVLTAWAVEKSWLGAGLAAIRDDETAAESSGVPSLALKVIATTLSGALMGMAGAPFPFFISYVDPPSVFNLTISVNAIAMPLVGGTGAWWGPVLGAILLGSAQQILTVTISSAVNVLCVGVLLVAFLILAPNGGVGLLRQWTRSRP